MDNKNLLRNGIASTVVVMLCCFTPLLVIILGFAGLSTIIGGLDYGLFPMLFASLGVVSYALYLRSGNKGPSPNITIIVLVILVSALLFWLEFRYALRISITVAALVAAYAFYLHRLVNTPTA
ncbi:MAG: mercury resistance system transport protein MerF [Gammaproteobacteria bacterium]